MSLLSLPFTSSSSTSKKSIIEPKKSRLPKNISRLPKSRIEASAVVVVVEENQPLSSIDNFENLVEIPPLSDKQPVFKIPTIPNRDIKSSSHSHNPIPAFHSIRPLKMSISSNTVDKSDSSSTPSRLKRLSLVTQTQPSSSSTKNSIFSAREVDKSQSSSRAGETIIEGEEGRQRIDNGNEDMTRNSTSSARTPVVRRVKDTTKRSSLSYSPGTRMIRQLSETSDEERQSYLERDMVRRKSINGLIEDEFENITIRDKPKIRGETMAEKHSDLLREIAQKESLVNELRRELQAQEASLESLKSRYTQLISQTYSSTEPSPPSAPQSSDAATRPHRGVSSSSRTRSMSSSSSTMTSPSISTASTRTLSPPLSETDELFSTTSIQNFITSTIGPNGEALLSPEVVEGGKRFWGTLMRTVSAAASGTVPSSPLLEHNAAGGGTETAEPGLGIDLSKFQGILPWTTNATTTPTHNSNKVDSRSTIPESSPTTSDVAEPSPKSTSGDPSFERGVV